MRAKSGPSEFHLSLGKAVVFESVGDWGKVIFIFLSDDVLYDLPFPCSSNSGRLESAEVMCQFQLWLISFVSFKPFLRQGCLGDSSALNCAGAQRVPTPCLGML